MQYYILNDATVIKVSKSSPTQLAGIEAAYILIPQYKIQIKTVQQSRLCIMCTVHFGGKNSYVLFLKQNGSMQDFLL